MIANQMALLLTPSNDALTDTERRLVAALLADPEHAMFMSVRELAGKAGAHESSAVRLARKLGFDGYPALRKEFQSVQLQRTQASSAMRMATTLSSAGDGDVLRILVDKELASLHSVLDHVGQEQIDEAARQLAAARHVKVWASGNASILAELVQRRLRTAGFECQNISADGRELAESLVTLSGDDAVLVFAFRTEPDALAPLLRHAKRVGAHSVLVSDMLGHTLPERPGLLLAAPRGEAAEFLTLSVPMLIANAIVLTLARHLKNKAIRSLRTLDALRHDFGLPD